MVSAPPADDSDAATPRPAHDEERQRQVDRRHHRVGLEGAEGAVLDLPPCRRQLGHADGHGQAGVLHQQQGLVQQRGQCDAERLRQDHLAHGLKVAQPQRARGLDLARRDRAYRAAQVFTDIGRHHQADRHAGQDEFAAVTVEPIGHGLRQQGGHPEVPEQDVHQHRHIAMERNVGRDQRIGHRPARQPEHGQQAADQKSQAPGERGQRQGGQEPLSSQSGYSPWKMAPKSKT